MAYAPKKGLVDLFGGREDLSKGIIRCVGDPERRFSEDALRILRGFRFSAQLDFEIEENTLKAALDI
ncbi:MAG: polynucleotide adenylyltransferase, partial [Bacteroidaceae bacterium]|nr:polynucleotide adenylyltransferase [Bacteroidaceae bacterium]